MTVIPNYSAGGAIGATNSILPNLPKLMPADKKRSTVVVTLANGNNWITTINTDFAGACDYYFRASQFEQRDESVSRVVSVGEVDTIYRNIPRELLLPDWHMAMVKPGDPIVAIATGDVPWLTEGKVYTAINGYEAGLLSYRPYVSVMADLGRVRAMHLSRFRPESLLASMKPVYQVGRVVTADEYRRKIS